MILVRMGLLLRLGGGNVNYLILYMAVISVLIGMAVSAILVKIPLRPIQQLIDNMNRLAEGNFKVRIHFPGIFGKKPVMEELANSFNKMAEELENTEMLRSEFINNFSHEFKTPIVSIAGFAKLLKRGDLTEEQREEYLDIIEEESLRLSRMATNVLNLTRVENQAILTNITEFNLSEQLRGCVLLLERKWEKKGLSFQLEFGEHMVLANEELLREVWINLLYKFYQADESHSSEGSGVGLAIVKRVLMLHQGSISVRSEEGRTVFTAELPADGPG